MKQNKHSNQVRIIGGTHRGSLVKFSNAEGLRPTPDSVREKLFNWLGQDLTGQLVLDLFAGSAVLGFESISRNAKTVYINEKNRQVIRDIEDNAQRLKLGAIVLSQKDAFSFLDSCQESFDVVYLDPPYAFTNWELLWEKLNRVINLKTLVYLEAGVIPPLPEQFTVLKQGKSGMSRFVLLAMA